MSVLEHESIESQGRYLVKVSGDLVERDSFYSWLQSIYNTGDYFLIIAGGGSAISKRLNEAGFDWSFGENGREIADFNGQELARQVLRSQKATVRTRLKQMDIEADVVIPVTDCGGEIIHINGDTVVKNLYSYFDQTYVLTIDGRKKSFMDYEKLQVVPIAI